MSGRLVAATMTTLASLEKPSISTRRALRVYLPLVVGAAAGGVAVAGPSDESISSRDDAAGLLAFREEVSHAGGAYAHEHLGEVGTGRGVERDAGLTGHGPGQEGLAGAGRADGGNPGHLGAGGVEVRRVVEERHDLRQLLDGLVATDHVGEAGGGRLGQLGLGRREGLGAGASAPRPPFFDIHTKKAMISRTGSSMAAIGPSGAASRIGRS